VNVEGNPAGMALLKSLGAHSVPVVSKGDKFTYAQSLTDVVDFLGLDVKVGPQLSMPELVEKLEIVLAAAERLWLQFPNARLGESLPHRDRPFRVLGHHNFRIPEAFVELTQGDPLTYQKYSEKPPADMQSVEQIVDYGRDVRDRFRKWWLAVEDVTGDQRVPTYYGDQPILEVLERTTWHAAQHVRQTHMLLEQFGIAADRPLTREDLAGLPVPEKVWDDEPGATAT
jgi:hypothetical protein